MSDLKFGAAIHRAILECETAEELAGVFEAVKSSREWGGFTIVADPTLPPGMIAVSAPFRFADRRRVSMPVNAACGQDFTEEVGS